MKVALVHDWITGLRGGERCLQAFLKMYPSADVFTLVHVPGTTSPEIDERVKGTSFIQRLPAAQKIYRHCLPLYPFAISGFDFAGYDLVVSLSHAAAKNITVPPGVPHISYCFTPMRYIWDQTWNYFGNMTPFLWPVLAGLRRWDLKGGARPDVLVGISKFIGARIRLYYGRRAEVIFPPVDTSWIHATQAGVPGEAFLYAGALVPYKKAHLAIEACNRLKEPLWIAGAGPEEKKLRKIAGPTVQFLGRVSDEELAKLYARSRALLFPGIEDFGMIPVECMAAGRPVIGAFGGGLTETVAGVFPRYGRDPAPYGASDSLETATGVFVPQREGEALQIDSMVKAISFFRDHEGEFKVESCTQQAALFSPERFEDEWYSLLGRYGFDVEGVREAVSS